ncbi:MAG: type II secretion system protein [bacterium]|nr:type II secretion system protein [bacterium]
MKRNNSGFTLIEVLMVVFILGIIVVLGSNLFFSIMKGASKAELTKEVKQNGDYALGMMVRMIRNAKKITVNSDGQTCSLSMQKFKIINQDDTTTELACKSDITDQVAKISAGTSPLTGPNVTLTSGGSGCPGTFSFSCVQPSMLEPANVTISFTLYQKGTSGRPEELAQASFKTTVSLRNY